MHINSTAETIENLPHSMKDYDPELGTVLSGALSLAGRQTIPGETAEAPQTAAAGAVEAPQEAENFVFKTYIRDLDTLSLTILRQYFQCDHRGMAEALLSIWLNDVKWDSERQRFMVFSQRRGHWVRGGANHEDVHRLVNDFSDRLYAVCQEVIDSDADIMALLTTQGSDKQARDDRAEGKRRADAVRAWSKVLSGTGNIRSTVTAVSVAANSCQAQDFDQASHLLNFANGTFDVTTGELRPHSASDMLASAISRTLDLTLAEKPLEEAAPLFHQLLWRMCGAPGERTPEAHQAMYEAVCRCLGYTLYGANPAKKMPIFVGASNIGKNQVLEIVGTLLETLACMSLKPSLLVQTRNDRHDGDESPLMGKRLAVLNEMSDKQTLDENQVLRFVNPEGTVVSLRQMRQDPITVPITWTIVVTTNSLPHGDLPPQVCNRLAVFHLSGVEVPEHDQWDVKGAILRGGVHDGVRYEAEMDTVLAHLVTWFRQWWVASQEGGNGLITLDEMREALADYQVRNRSLSEMFIDECCETGEDAYFLPSSGVMDAFKTWVAREHPDRARTMCSRDAMFKAIDSLHGVSRRTRPRGNRSPLLLGWDGIRMAPVDAGTILQIMHSSVN